jgi:hypothetical protein
VDGRHNPGGGRSISRAGSVARGWRMSG